MQRATPPFRADHVGSLLRPPALKQARAKHERNEISAEALRAIEDREIEKAIKKQEEIGLGLATDGEFRRSWWHFDFFRGLDGVTFYTSDHGIQFRGVQTKAEAIRIDGKIGFSGHHMLDHFKFLKAHTRVAAKMTIPAPSTFHFRQGRAAISKEVYPDLDVFFDDLAGAYRAAIRAFSGAGCRYLQLDDTAWAMLCDPNERAQSKKRGDDPDSLPQRYAQLTNAALEGKPADMAITMHSCRGNFRSTLSHRGLTILSPSSCSAIPISTAISSNMTASAPAASSHCGFSRRARSSSCSASSPQKAASLRIKTISSAASTRRQNTSRSISFACRRNAALLPQRRATSSPRTNNGRSCG